MTVFSSFLAKKTHNFDKKLSQFSPMTRKVLCARAQVLLEEDIALPTDACYRALPAPRRRRGDTKNTKKTTKKERKHEMFEILLSLFLQGFLGGAAPACP